MFIDLLVKFNEYLTDYSEGSISDNTLSAYLTDTKYFLKYVGDRELSSVTSRDITKFIGSPGFRKPFAPCSTKTRRRRLSSIRAFFNFLIDESTVSSNPATFRRVKARQQKYVPQFLKPSEVERVLSVCNDILVRTIIEVLFNTGIRLEEMRTCQLSSVDLNKREMKVLGKGDKERYIPFSSKLAQKLRSYIEQRKPIPGVTVLFISGQGLSLTKNHIEYLFRKISKLSGIYIRPHKLRHSFATNAIERGMPPKTLQRILGHESQVTTDWYTHIEPNIRSDYDTAFP